MVYKGLSVCALFFCLPFNPIPEKNTLTHLLSKKRKELLSLTVLPLFLSSNYTFPLKFELILIFIITLLAGLIATANQSEETKKTGKLLNSLLLLISFYLIINSLFKFINNIKDITTLNFWLSFGIEYFVWIINIPIIYLSKKMITIENKVIFSDKRNILLTYLSYLICLTIIRIKLLTYRRNSTNISSYIQNASELPSFGGNRILITLNTTYIPNNLLICLVKDAIFGKNKFTGIKNKKEKYPNILEIYTSKNELYSFWKDPFISNKWTSKYNLPDSSPELIAHIKLIKD